MKTRPPRLEISFVVSALVAAVWIVGGGAASQTPVALDGDDIGGIVASRTGPEAGVWVIAETTDLPTKFAKIVVTDAGGRYVIPDLPNATYTVWVRGYGLVDSEKVSARPGQSLDLTAVPAPNAREAAAYYPADSWFSLLRVPPKSAFPGSGLHGNGISERIETQTEYVNRVKGCFLCHQLGNQKTREIPPELGEFDSHADAWARRIQSGQAGPWMSRDLAAIGAPSALGMFADWTDRIAAGEYPTETPPRPAGLERNIVISMWDWGRETSVVHDEISSDRRNPRLNADGKVYGVDEGLDLIVWIDPETHEADERELPLREGERPWASIFGDRVLEPSPYWGEELYWPGPGWTHNPMMDEKGRVWMTHTFRNPGNSPDFCTEGNKFAEYYPMRMAIKQAAVYDPETDETTLVDTCFGTHHLQFGEDADSTLYFSKSGNVVGWIKTKVWDDTQDIERSQGWCPAVVDTNGDGQITVWTEPNEPFDPTKDRRFNISPYGNVVNPVDNSVWWATESGFPSHIGRLELGPNPPETCKAEIYELPMNHPDIPGEYFVARGVDVDRNGVIWAGLAGSGHIASFDRSKCQLLNGPTATGQHCAEGWSFYEAPGPKIADTAINADWFYLTWVDQFDTFGLGANTPMVPGVNGDSILALLPETEEFIRLRVPYPMGFYPRGMDGRIDDPDAGWKGRSLWANFGSVLNWHLEGGKGTRSKAVKFQLRPDPLAK